MSERILVKANGVLDDATTLDTADDVLNDNAALGDEAIVGFLLGSQLTTFGLLEWSRMLHVGQFKAHKATVVKQFATRRQRIGCGIGNRFVMHTAFIAVADKQDTQRVDQQEIFDGMFVVLAAVAISLFRALAGTRNGAFSAVVQKGGGASAC